MHPESGPASDAPAPGARPPRRPRWWPAALILAGTAFALLAIHLPESADRQRRIVLTATVMLVAFALLLVWLLLLSRLAARQRLGALAALVVAALAFAALLDFRGLSGDLVPQLEWRWSRPPAAATGDVATGDAASGGPAAPAFDPRSLVYPQLLGPSRDGTVDAALDPDWERRGPRCSGAGPSARAGPGSRSPAGWR